jgi:hypothetical protein
MDTQTAKNPHRVAAGRRNGRLAANRKSAEGRAKSAQNAAKHLLASPNTRLLPIEDPRVFKAFATAIEATLAPQDPYEQTLVTQIIQCRWKLYRIDNLEFTAQSLEIERAIHAPFTLPNPEHLRDSDLLDWISFRACYSDPAFQALHRYRAYYDRSLLRAQKALLEYRQSPKPDSIPYCPDEPEQPAEPNQPTEPEQTQQPQTSETKVSTPAPQTSETPKTPETKVSPATPPPSTTYKQPDALTPDHPLKS